MSVRFAPSPTGAFHLGNFRTAWISWRWSRELGLPWVVRFEDIDSPRVVPGAQQQQLQQMRELGLVPDRVLVQSANFERHYSLFDRARKEGAVYPCSCSRKEVLASLASAPHHPESVYSGRCRPAQRVEDVRGPNYERFKKTLAQPTLASASTDDAASASEMAWRFRSPDPSGKDDIIIARADMIGGKSSFVPSYHWACAIDDFDEGHQLLVRAHDLASATPVQRRIQAWLHTDLNERPFPAVFHTALVVSDDGHRLEKRTPGVTWQEWLAREGPSTSADHRLLRAKELCQKFEHSFQVKPADFHPEKVWGEPHTQLKLGELGL